MKKMSVFRVLGWIGLVCAPLHLLTLVLSAPGGGAGSANTETMNTAFPILYIMLLGTCFIVSVQLAWGKIISRGLRYWFWSLNTILLIVVFTSINSSLDSGWMPKDLLMFLNLGLTAGFYVPPICAIIAQPRLKHKLEHSQQ